MATYIYEQQLDRISAGLAQVKERIAATYEGDVPIVVTGMGRIFLAKRAAQKIGCDKILDLGDYVGDDAAVASTSVGAAWMVAAEREGRKVSWKR